jgi:hypothetical protein
MELRPNDYVKIIKYGNRYEGQCGTIKNMEVPGIARVYVEGGREALFHLDELKFENRN